MGKASNLPPEQRAELVLHMLSKEEPATRTLLSRGALTHAGVALGLPHPAT